MFGSPGSRPRPPELPVRFPGPPLMLQLLTSEPPKSRTDREELLPLVVVTLAPPSGRKQNRVAERRFASTVLPFYRQGGCSDPAQRAGIQRRVAVTSHPFRFRRSGKRTGCSALPSSFSMERMKTNIFARTKRFKLVDYVQ